MESNARYYRRRAIEERMAAQRAITEQARTWHAKLARDFAERPGRWSPRRHRRRQGLLCDHPAFALARSGRRGQALSLAGRGGERAVALACEADQLGEPRGQRPVDRRLHAAAFDGNSRIDRFSIARGERRARP